MKSITYKVCTKCGIEKSLNDYHKHPQTKDGRLGHCKVCQNKKSAQFREQNPNRMQAYKDKWIKENPERNLKHKKNWKINNREAYLTGKSAYAKAHRAEYNAQTARYRSQKLKATPKLSEFEEFAIPEIYSLCDLRSRLTKIKHHVDHYYPLVSDVLCGLHNLANLRIMIGIENQSKGNKLIGEEI
jgi:hypothetical protein